ncbi:MAG: BAX inhibitor (BI)-1/YccA family protein, partial [Proteobacteria bacterium]|nr:BAX inhibitor (BI)-1/YccA family protein [Pseudomonadota bacterium]
MYSSDNGRTLVIDQSRSQAATLFLAKVFNWMAIGLGLTGVTALVVAGTPALQQAIFGNKILFYGMIFGELGMVIYLSARI